MSENPTTILKIEVDGVEHDIGDTTARNALNDKQAIITANGILKGDGSGNISAATAGTDYPTIIIRDWSVT